MTRLMVDGIDFSSFTGDGHGLSPLHLSYCHASEEPADNQQDYRIAQQDTPKLVHCSDTPVLLAELLWETKQ